MIIREKLGNLAAFPDNGRTIDRLSLEWFETAKRILHRKTQSGKEIILKFLKQNQNLSQDDVLHQDERTLIVVDILACDAIVVQPASLYETAFVCYEIGNKHLPLFFENDTLLIPYEAPILRLLQASGLKTLRETRKLLNPLRTSVAPHSHGSSLFSKILQLTSPAPDA